MELSTVRFAEFSTPFQKSVNVTLELPLDPERSFPLQTPRKYFRRFLKFLSRISFRIEAALK